MYQNSRTFLILIPIQILALVVLSSSELLGILNPKTENNNPPPNLQSGNEEYSSQSTSLGMGLGGSSIFGLVSTAPHAVFEVINPQSPLPVLLKGKTLGDVVEPQGFELIREFVEKDGYNFKDYAVETHDGYFIHIFRINRRKKGQKSEEIKGKLGQPVYIGHGLLSSAADWIAQGKKKSLPYILADQGYDVWIANSRGNNYAMHHKNYDVSDDNFWNFSVHEMGKYDIPAIVDYMLNETKYDKVNYIGYSMSTTSYFICMSENPEYNKKINKMVAIAPAVFLTHVNPVGQLLAEAPLVDILIGMKVLTGGQLVPYPVLNVLNNLNIPVCSFTDLTFSVACMNLLQLLAGSSGETSPTCSSRAENFMPASSSGKTLVHYIQFFRNESFRQYDYGKKNSLYYDGADTPPEYNLNATTGNILVFVGSTDTLTCTQDVKVLMERLPNANLENLTIVKDFNHLNFVYADKAAKEVYSKIVDYFNSP